MCAEATTGKNINKIKKFWNHKYREMFFQIFMGRDKFIHKVKNSSKSMVPLPSSSRSEII